jgi:hypothetical protein
MVDCSGGGRGGGRGGEGTICKCRKELVGQSLLEIPLHTSKIKWGPVEREEGGEGSRRESIPKCLHGKY